LTVRRRARINAGSAQQQEAADGDVRTTTTGGATGAPDRPRASWGDDLAAALLGTWVVGGLFLDGWAHVNQPGLETFFSTWHGLFYMGFLVSTVCWPGSSPATSTAASTPPWSRPATASDWSGWPCS
jgi:hypothetical protein